LVLAYLSKEKPAASGAGRVSRAYLVKAKHREREKKKGSPSSSKIQRREPISINPGEEIRGLLWGRRIL